MSVQLALILIGFGIGYAEFRSTMEYLRKTIDDIDRKTDTFVTKENLSYIMQNIDTKISALDQNVKTMQDQVADLYRQHRLQERE